MSEFTDLIPRVVKEALREHFEAKEGHAKRAYRGGQEEEDTLTGAYFAPFADGPHSVELQDGESWSFQITFRKLRSKGKEATENLVGADGILHLLVTTPEGTFVKGLLFQAKTDWTTDTRVSGQAQDLLSMGAASAVFNYTADGADVYDVEAAAKAGGKRTRAGEPTGFVQFIDDQLLACTVGAVDLYYDADRRVLLWHSDDGYVETPFVVKDEVKINLQEGDLEFDLRLPVVEKAVPKQIWKAATNPPLKKRRFSESFRDRWQDRQASTPTLTVQVGKKKKKT